MRSSRPALVSNCAPKKWSSGMQYNNQLLFKNNWELVCVCKTQFIDLWDVNNLPLPVILCFGSSAYLVPPFLKCSNATIFQKKINVSKKSNRFIRHVSTFPKNFKAKFKIHMEKQKGENFATLKFIFQKFGAWKNLRCGSTLSCVCAPEKCYKPFWTCVVVRLSRSSSRKIKKIFFLNNRTFPSRPRRT